jgi:hypothetical protein
MLREMYLKTVVSLSIFYLEVFKSIMHLCFYSNMEDDEHVTWEEHS